MPGKSFKTLFALILPALLLIESGNAAFRQNGKFPLTASVTIITTNKITGNGIKDMVLPQIYKPEEDVVIHITPDGSVGKNNTATYSEYPEPENPSYNISSSSSDVVQITAYNQIEVEGIEFKSISGSYDNGKSNNLLSNPLGVSSQKDDRKIKLGGEVKVSKNILPGKYYPSINLEIGYE